MDTRDPIQRRRIMQAVKRENTKPELTVRRLLHSLGYRYRLHRKELPGTPDIVFPSRKKVIFVNGCFWHGHGCKKGQLPKSRLDYWKPKIAKNVERDKNRAEQLALLAWRVFVVWQCQTTDIDDLAKVLRNFLDEP